MFFAPSILELTKPIYNNTVKLVCFSSGDAVDPSFGAIRQEELRHSAAILGIPEANLILLDQFQDGMDIEWDETEISQTIQLLVMETDNLVLITFDETGVSNHPNHISLYYGTRKYVQQTQEAVMYKLKLLNFLEKYSFTLLTNIELFVDLMSKLILGTTLKLNINISFFNTAKVNSIKIYSDLNMLSASYAAMAYGHFSQMVWFRYGWLILSRYLTFNNLIEEH